MRWLSNCVERCPFDAIKMRKTANSRKLKASIIKENCMGCGVCVVGCKERALTYELVKPQEYIQVPPPKPGAVIGVPCVCMNLK
jgi:ferredoxin